MKFSATFLVICLTFLGFFEPAHAKSQKTWLLLKIENPGTLTKDEVNLIQMSMIKLEDLPPMYYTAVSRYAIDTNEVTSRAKLFKLPMHHDGYIFLKIKPKTYIFTEEGQIDTHRMCYSGYNKIITPVAGAINFLGVIDRNLIIKNIDKFAKTNAIVPNNIAPKFPSQDEVDQLKQFMLTNKRFSKMKNNIVPLKLQEIPYTTFTSKTKNRLNCPK